MKRTALALAAVALLAGAALAVLDNFDPHPLDNGGQTKCSISRSGGTTFWDLTPIYMEAATGDWVGGGHRLSHAGGTYWIADGEPVVDVVGDLAELLGS